MDKKRRDKLLVLKAFYLGHTLSEHQNKSVALEMINKAIKQLEQMGEQESKLRLLFYMLLKAEIKRHDSEVIKIRKYAKEIAAEIGGRIFDDFMSIENATQTTKSAYGLNKGIIADKGVKTTETWVVGTGFHTRVVSYDIACRAVGIDENSLSDKELHFLYHISLAEMLKKHGIR